MSIAERLKMARGELSQKAAALKCGIKQQAWNSYEKGVSVPGGEAIQNICRSLSISADWLLGLPERGGSATVTAGDGAAVSLGSGSATASNCRDCPILLDFINRRSAGKP